MKTTIIPIGNSKGVRIPKAVLEQCHIEKEAIMEVEKGAIVIYETRGRACHGGRMALRTL